MAPNPTDCGHFRGVLLGNISGQIDTALLLSIDKRQATTYACRMIRSFRHRGLKALYDGRTAKRVAPDQIERLRDVLTVLDRSRGPSDMNLPGFRLHPLKGDLKGHWSVSVSGNWRVTFRFEDGNATDVDYLDYH